jgi:hypothetical protein
MPRDFSGLRGEMERLRSIVEEQRARLGELERMVAARDDEIDGQRQLLNRLRTDRKQNEEFRLRAARYCDLWDSMTHRLFGRRLSAKETESAMRGVIEGAGKLWSATIDDIMGKVVAAVESLEQRMDVVVSRDCSPVATTIALVFGKGVPDPTALQEVATAFREATRLLPVPPEGFDGTLMGLLAATQISGPLVYRSDVAQALGVKPGSSLEEFMEEVEEAGRRAGRADGMIAVFRDLRSRLHGLLPRLEQSATPDDLACIHGVLDHLGGE